MNSSDLNADRASSQASRLRLVLVINVVMVIGLVLVGIASHSLGVLAAAGDYIADSAGLALGLVAVRLSRHPTRFGKATSVVALINATLLFVASVVVIIEAVRRLLHKTPRISGLSAMVIALVAMVAMIIGAVILKGDGSDDDDLHMRSVILDTIADAAAAGAVAVAGLVIFVTKRFFWLDSVLAGLIALVVAFHAAKLARTAAKAVFS